MVFFSRQQTVWLSIFFLIPCLPQASSFLGHNDCSKLDIMFLLDGSTSVGEKNFLESKKLLKDMVSYFRIGKDGVRVGLVTFSDSIESVFDMNAYHDANTLHRVIDNVAYPKGTTIIGNGLRHLKETSFTSRRGDRKDVRNIAIVITDGISREQNNVKSQAEALRSAGVCIYTIGIGSEVDVAALKTIANEPSEHFMSTSPRDSIRALIIENLKAICEHKVTTETARLNFKCPNKRQDILRLKDNTCYYIFTNGADFNTAESRCCQMKGHLLWLQSESDYLFADDELRNYMPTWTGAVRSSGHYKWSYCGQPQSDDVSHMHWADENPIPEDTHAIFDEGESFGLYKTTYKLTYICQVCARGTFGSRCNLPCNGCSECDPVFGCKRSH